ncbi:hypothetical protein Syun_008354 [Stephania yunnanensis]|uniref:Tyrosinase copper-binding domain-containing protein n=1 Tax=Stephania yunnanensis TaxID=152371 RepID=A0AAP0KF43_9MAGN
MYRQVVLNRTAKLFLGMPYRARDPPNPGAGSIEMVPHNTAHAWTGDPTSRFGEDMGNFYSSGRDPIFFALHSNVDRIWSIWCDKFGTNYTDSDWLNASFLFYDENQKLVRATVSDALSISQLRYAYQDVPIEWINARPTSKRPKGSRASNDLKKKAVKAADAFPRSVNNGLIRVIVKRPVINKSRTKKEKEEQPEVLVIEGIELDAGKTVKFDVLVNDDDESTMPDKSEFAGSFVNVSHRHAGMEGEMKIKTSLRLGITELLEDLGVEDDDELVVTIVPRIGTQNVIIGEEIACGSVMGVSKAACGARLGAGLGAAPKQYRGATRSCLSARRISAERGHECRMRARSAEHRHAGACDAGEHLAHDEIMP